ncbi:MAG: hypothetical protein WBC71_09795 [Salaquimonas sp.]
MVVIFIKFINYEIYMQLPFTFKNRARSRFWLALALIIFLGFISFGSAFQNEKSDTFISIPTLWIFGLIALPFALYFIVKLFFAKLDRLIR